jgi:hypothetical protein
MQELCPLKLKIPGGNNMKEGKTRLNLEPGDRN